MLELLFLRTVIIFVMSHKSQVSQVLGRSSRMFQKSLLLFLSLSLPLSLSMYFFWFVRPRIKSGTWFVIYIIIFGNFSFSTNIISQAIEVKGKVV